MILRAESFEQTDGLGLLELKVAQDELVLFWDGELLAYDAGDCAGSVGRFIALLQTTEALMAQVQVETNAQRGFQETAPLHEQIAPLLELLPNGSYELCLEEEVECIISDVRHAVCVSTGWLMGYYPGDGYDSETFITTQPDKVIDEERVNFYMGEIGRGVRPALIVLSSTRGYDSSFILDGHHKMRAYTACGIKPRVLRIKFQQQTTISAAFAHQIFDGLEYDDVKSYLREKDREELRDAKKRLP